MTRGEGVNDVIRRMKFQFRRLLRELEGERRADGLWVYKWSEEEVRVEDGAMEDPCWFALAAAFSTYLKKRPLPR